MSNKNLSAEYPHWKNFLLLVVSILLFLIVLEAVSRIFVQVPRPYLVPDGRLIFDSRSFWLNLPDLDQKFDNRIDFRDARMRTDAAGLRRVMCQESLPPDTPRVFIFGDSQTFGFGLADEDTWISKLQCSIRSAPQPRRLVNLGVPATNIDQYFVRLRLILDDLKPEDAVVLTADWNDVHTKVSITNPRLIGATCPDPTWLHFGVSGLAACFNPQKPRYYGEAKSFYRSLYEATGIFIPDFSSAKGFLRTVVFSSAIAYVLLPKLEALYLSLRDKNTLQILEAGAIESNIELLRVFDSVVRQKTTNISYLLLPSRISYVDDIYAIYSKNGTVFSQQDFLAHMMAPFCASPENTCLSLFDALHTDKRGVNEFAFDGHLNATGAAKVANYLQAKLFK